MREGILRQIIESKSKTFLAFCFCFLIGISAASFLHEYISLKILFWIALGFVPCWLIWFQNKNMRFFLLCFSFIFIGLLRYTIAFPISDHHISNYDGEKMKLTGVIAAEPDVRQDGVRYIVKIQETNSLPAGRQGKKQIDAVEGNVYVKLGLYPRYEYGDTLSLSCKIKKPEAIDTEDGKTFRYDMYLARSGVFATCESPYAEKIGEGEGNKILAGIFSFKQAIAVRVNRLWHEPYAGFMAGLLYGYRGGLGSLNTLFSRTGVTHIIAISGFNITLIANILITMCVYMLIPRKKAFWLIALGIFLFVIFAGASASVVRAGIMGVIVLLAKQLGRMSRIVNVMILTAVIMALQNPFVLLWDAGFQLSFLSTLGLVYISPILTNSLARMPESFGMRESLIATLSATFMTLPLILFQFGRLSLVTVFVNLLILWIIPWIMFAGFLAVVFSYLFFPLGDTISFLAWAGMRYIVGVVEWFANLKFAAVDVSVNIWMFVGMYAILIWWIYKKRTRNSVPL